MGLFRTRPRDPNGMVPVLWCQYCDFVHESLPNLSWSDSNDLRSRSVSYRATNSKQQKCNTSPRDSAIYRVACRQYILLSVAQIEMEVFFFPHVGSSVRLSVMSLTAVWYDISHDMIKPITTILFFFQPYYLVRCFPNLSFSSLRASSSYKYPVNDRIIPPLQLDPVTHGACGSAGAQTRALKYF